VKAEYINPFLIATKNVIETMSSTTVKTGKPEIKKGKTTWGAVSGIIGLASKEMKGCMIVSFEETTIVHITNQMLGEAYQNLNKDVIDAVGEITNQICGGAKSKFSEMGVEFDMASPVIISGREIEIHQLTDGMTITIPFTTSAGAFVIEANLAQKK